MYIALEWCFFRDTVEKRFWSGTFYLATGMITVMVLLPSLQVLLESGPVLWLFMFVMSSKYRVSDSLSQYTCITSRYISSFYSVNILCPQSGPGDFSHLVLGLTVLQILNTNY